MRGWLVLLLALMLVSGSRAQQADILSKVWEENLVPQRDRNTRVFGVWVYDIDGDGFGEAVVVTTGIKTEGTVRFNRNHINVFSYDGERKWRRELDNEILAVVPYDISNNGLLEFFISSGESIDRIHRGNVRVIDGFGANRANTDFHALVRSARIADIDADRYYEVAAGSSQRVFLMRPDGNVLWMYPPRGQELFEQTVDAVEFYDLDASGKLDVIAGSDAVYFIGWHQGLMGKYVLEPELHPLKRGVKYLAAGNFAPNTYADIVAVSRSNIVHLLSVDKIKAKTFDTEVVRKFGGRELEVSLQWEYDPKCDINVFHTLNIDGDDYSEVIIACSNNRIIALDNNGLPLWDYPLDGRPNDIFVGDIDGDGFDDLLIGASSGSIYLIDTRGNFRWRYDVGSPVERVSAGFRDSVENIFIVAATGDLMAHAYVINETYSLRRRADTLYNLGQNAYIRSDYDEAVGHFTEAKRLYTQLGYDRGVMNSQSFISNIELGILDERRKEAEQFYQKAQDLFFLGDYGGSLSFAKRAREIFEEFNNHEGMVRCDLLELQIQRVMSGDQGGGEAQVIVTTTTIASAEDTGSQGTYIIVIFLAFLAVAALIILKKRSEGGAAKDEEMLELSDEEWGEIAKKED
jgi:tetratricopeptide (TPR) repeat protein